MNTTLSRKKLVFILVALSLLALTTILTSCQEEQLTREEVAGIVATALAEQPTQQPAEPAEVEQPAIPSADEIAEALAQRMPTTAASQPTEEPVEQPTEQIAPVEQTAPTLDVEDIQLGSIEGCPTTVIQEQFINGEQFETIVGETTIRWYNVAIGKYHCVSVIEGRFFEGFHPSETHVVAVYFGAAENVSLFQGTNRVLPIGTDIRQLLYQHALDKCRNYQDAKVEPEPIQLAYVDLETRQIVRQDTTCAAIMAENPLPLTIGAIPGDDEHGLPHYAVTGEGWGTTVKVAESSPSAGAEPEMASQDVSIQTVEYPATEPGESRFDSENRGLNCAGNGGPSFGNNADGAEKALSQGFDPMCIYTLDAINSENGITVRKGEDDAVSIFGAASIRGEDLLEALETFDASIWPVPAGWNADKTARQFAANNCSRERMEIPVLVYEDDQWHEVASYDCTQ